MPTTRNNYIYVDLENLGDVDLARIEGRPVKVILAVGPNIKRVSLTLAEQMLKFAPQVRILKSTVVGKNALDFLIVNDLGQQRTQDPHGYFHILSKDTDFHSIVENLKPTVLVSQRKAMNEIPLLMNVEERVERVRIQLAKITTAGPQSRETLEKFLQSSFGNALSPEELKRTINALDKYNVLHIANGTVVYPKK